MNRWQTLKTHLSFLDWLFNPLQDREVAAIYDLLADQSPTQRGRYLNLGYWTEAIDVDAACDALAALVADTAQLNHQDCLLDVGFGFGDQDLYWWQHHQPRRIIGLNITTSQVVVARQRVAALGLTKHIDLRHGSATAMQLTAGSVDKVVALECAFHFRTRERFFAEAWRVLRPGGRLVLADIIPLPLVTDWRWRLLQRLNWALIASRFAIPGANAYPAPEYAKRLAAAGFAHVELRSIRDEVYPPLHQYLRTHPEVLARLHPLLRFAVRLALPFDAQTVYAGLDYVIATAVKPG
ncbi:methyltransferase domain-containing protein [Rhodoferax sp. 4810]|uniref:Methyltransferase domain-containing protein n=1 Tax=Thiospirillum jenense TaxID=1653858 RepID=A0A839H272_9GAMM|nr:class I SAM-dependent methyltransferase [Thiospirillum jenense]MBB1073194.1 methyltransferase domain-containing protein [Rhodoferax jenense]MBB1124645.1 methyltransferase domain-containing protein [Thiospirillum jenense]